MLKHRCLLRRILHDSDLVVIVPTSKVACVIPTYNAGAIFHECLTALYSQFYPIDVIIIDSSSSDGTFEMADSFPFKLLRIPKSSFSHGGTRQVIVDRYNNYDFYIFLTQDAVLSEPFTVEKILRLFDDKDVGCVYGRQVPHKDASLLAQHARYFNYPSLSYVRSLDDSDNFGIKTAFNSNSFSAYRASALSDVGGFPDDLILSEDMYVSASMLLSGWKVGYASEAVCKHSHDYTIKQEFSRYFDIGVFHSQVPWIRENFGGAGKEGLKYVLSELSFLGMRNLHLWPLSLLRNFFKILGFRLGLLEEKVPLFLKRRLSMNKGFWK